MPIPALCQQQGMVTKRLLGRGVHPKAAFMRLVIPCRISRAVPALAFLYAEVIIVGSSQTTFPGTRLKDSLRQRNRSWYAEFPFLFECYLAVSGNVSFDVSR